MHGPLAASLYLSLALAAPPPAPVSVQAATAPAPAATAPPQASPPAAAAPASAKLAGLDAFVATAMQDWKVPGVGLAVVQNRHVILVQGYGRRDLEAGLPVTARTLFPIGSITKSFTAASLGILVDQGKLDWDKPVREFLPAFRLHDPVASEHVTPRDLVTHRSGLPRHDAFWYNSQLSRPQMIERLRYLEPSQDFRSSFQYNNLMFMAAGYLAGQVAGMTWEDLVRERIFVPLGMHASNFSVARSQKSRDFARPYKIIDGGAKETVKEVPFRIIDKIGPSGSINSNAEDMAQYLLMYLNGGKHGDTPVLSESNVQQMTTPQMVSPGAMRWSELGYTSYGLGLAVGSYRGHVMVSHGGAIDGFTALLSFLPQDGVGVVVLTNLDSDRNSLPTALAYGVFDRLLGLDLVPWSQRFLDELHTSDASKAGAATAGFTNQKQGTHPSHDLPDYRGEYENPGYGTVSIGLEKGELSLVYNRMSAPLQHFHYDIFATPADALNPLEKTRVSFFTDQDGDIGSLAIPMEPAVEDIVFRRRPDRSLADREFLARFVGEYDLGPIVMTISLRGEKTLILSLPGGQEYELVAKKPTKFQLQGVADSSIEFKPDASEAALYQPSGTMLAKRRR